MHHENTILTVGLESGVQSLLSLFLTRTARVRHAHNLREALTHLENKKIDLVVGRLERGGATLCQVMRKTTLWHHTPVVLVLSDDALGGKEFAEQIGANAILPSSLARDQIIHVVRRFLSTGLERSRPRISVQLPVQISNPVLMASGQAHNISRGGVYVEAQCDIPIQTRVDLKIRLPELECDITPGGTVVWQRDGQQPGSRGMGIEFVQIAPEEMRALTDFIDLRQSNPANPAFALLG
ncbi:MAG: PilZ domain-containing protein [Myxococcota bacterium]|nr:PilZ domain-containing protein [Myxococcota bacterium]